MVSVAGDSCPIGVAGQSVESQAKRYEADSGHSQNRFHAQCHFSKLRCCQLMGIRMCCRTAGRGRQPKLYGGVNQCLERLDVSDYTVLKWRTARCTMATSIGGDCLAADLLVSFSPVKDTEPMTHFTWIDGSIVGVYLLATMVAGIMVRKYVARVDDFLVAGREMNVYLGIASLAATEFGIVTCMYTPRPAIRGVLPARFPGSVTPSPCSSLVGPGSA